jgi:hypothetical protein
MPHLTPAQLIDLAEGTGLDASAPHLAACETCRRELAGLRAMLSEAAGVEVPEPSPLFWEQLSGRVRAAVAEESARPQSWREWMFTPRVWAPALGAGFAVLLAAVLWPRAVPAPAIPSTPVTIVETTALPPLGPLGTADDPQLRFVAAYATPLDWDEMRDEVAMVAGDSSEAVAGALTAAERRELQRLLSEALAQAHDAESRS